MRIIEPHQLRSKPSQRSGRRIKWVLPLFVAVAVLGSLGLVLAKPDAIKDKSPASSENQQVTVTESVPQQPLKLRTFTGEEFRKLYDSFAYPNTVEITTTPPISGNSAADDRIESLAFKRGYKLRSAPVAPLSKTPEGFPLQEKAIKPWLDMKTAAAKEGIALGLVSTFRAVDEQRLIFMQRLNATGITLDEVASGQADSSVNEVLITTSIPGTSRHHTGYTIDIKCGNQDFNFFANTICFKWLSKNNYENAKKFGWLPSYPEGVADQGPEPEAWEYVWVGVEALTEK
jgi:zinc D-Ala-D-Ala carboxypeptidase